MSHLTLLQPILPDVYLRQRTDHVLSVYPYLLNSPDPSDPGLRARLSALLQDLGTRGILFLLKLRCTEGSVEGVPPPLSSLWKAFNALCGRGTLTEGARAVRPSIG
jgi:hypothetical protein